MNSLSQVGHVNDSSTDCFRLSAGGRGDLPAGELEPAAGDPPAQPAGDREAAQPAAAAADSAGELGEPSDKDDLLTFLALDSTVLWRLPAFLFRPFLTAFGLVGLLWLLVLATAFLVLSFRFLAFFGLFWLEKNRKKNCLNH
jgi:hypothetical protein